MDTAKNQITPTIKEQILKVRSTGETNMFDCAAVVSIANREGWYELAVFLSDMENWNTYNQFIMTGKTEGA